MKNNKFINMSSCILSVISDLISAYEEYKNVKYIFDPINEELDNDSIIHFTKFKEEIISSIIKLIYLSDEMNIPLDKALERLLKTNNIMCNDKQFILNLK